MSVSFLVFALACQDYDLSGLDDAAGGEANLVANPNPVRATGVAGQETLVQVTLTNSGGGMLFIDELSIDGSDWAVADPNADNELASGESTELTLSYTPSGELGDGILWVYSNDGDSPETPVPLIGQAKVPDLLVSDLNFGKGFVDCPMSGLATVTNLGTADALVVDLGANVETYVPAEGALPFTLAPGEWKEVEVWWTPVAEGADPAILQVEEDTLGAFDGALSGDAGIDSVSFEVSQVDFGTLYVECSDLAQPRLYNNSTCPVTLTDLSLDYGDFDLDIFVLPRTIEPGGFTWVDLSFTPDDERLFSDVLTAGFDHGQVLELPLLGDGLFVYDSESFDVVEPAAEAIYLHSSSALSTYDQGTGTLTSIGSTGSSLYDIAIDEWGQLWGIGGSTLYQVDSSTGMATSYMALSGGGNGLAVLADGTLIITDGTTLSEVDWSTGTLTTLATLSSGYSSGDVVEWDGSLYWTVAGVGSGDSLFEYDTGTGALTELGSTGVSGLWGIAAPDGDLLAFSSSGTMYELDISSGAVLSSSSVSGSWYGAAHNPNYGLDPSYIFHLVDVPLDEFHIEVQVNSVVSSDWTYDATENAIVFEDGTVLSGGDVVDVVYALLSEC
ncbi:MAG: hypothetical protein ACI9VR_002968 [Cognaticolwellia sp.]|jgi:hypothetical protein